MSYGELKQVVVAENGELYFAFKVFDTKTDGSLHFEFNGYSYYIQKYEEELFMYLTLYNTIESKLFCLLIPKEVEQEIFTSLLLSCNNSGSNLN